MKELLPNLLVFVLNFQMRTDDMMQVFLKGLLINLLKNIASL